VSYSDGEEINYCELSRLPYKETSLGLSHFHSSSPSSRELFIIQQGETNKTFILTEREFSLI
jgi:hypothetical protein